MRKGLVIAVIVILVGLVIMSYDKISKGIVYKEENKDIGIGTVTKTHEIPVNFVIGGVVVVVGLVLLFMRGKK